MFKSEIEKILRKIGVEGKIEFSTPPKTEMGDLAFPCFDFAKANKISPNEAAQKIASKIEALMFNNSDSLIFKVQVFGPYVNFFLNSGVVGKIILNEIKSKKEKYGFNKIGKDKTVLIEYPSNNTHKELHVGHLRNICIGNALSEIFLASGYKVIPINYLNDFGAHVAKCLWGIQKFHINEIPPKGKEQKWLGEIYAEASKYLANHEEAKQEVFDLQQKLEARSKSIWPLYKKTRAWSIKKFDEVFKELGVKHKNVFYEQDVKDVGQKIVSELLQKNIAKIGDGGAIIVDLTSDNLDIGLLRKSNGAGLYLTSDLGLAVAKNKKYPKVSESIHLTGMEQNFYFKQLFRILELAGYHYKMTHIGYGLVTTPSGKMSSREGNVILYEDIYNEVYEKVYEETSKRHEDWDKNKIHKTVKILALASIKFEFLKHEAENGIIFDAKSAISFDGFTGPYALYTVARIASIARKMKIKKLPKKINYDLLKSKEEKKLIISLGNYGEVLQKAFANYNPSVITRYIFDLAQSYNDFYNNCSVFKAENNDLALARLDLSLLTKTVLQNALSILTINTIEEM